MIFIFYGSEIGSERIEKEHNIKTSGQSKLDNKYDISGSKFLKRILIQLDPDLTDPDLTAG